MFAPCLLSRDFPSFFTCFNFGRAASLPARCGSFPAKFNLLRTIAPACSDFTAICFMLLYYSPTTVVSSSQAQHCKLPATVPKLFEKNQIKETNIFCNFKIIFTKGLLPPFHNLIPGLSTLYLPFPCALRICFHLSFVKFPVLLAY